MVFPSYPLFFSLILFCPHDLADHLLRRDKKEKKRRKEKIEEEGRRGKRREKSSKGEETIEGGANG
jgi:hypothetical protein